MYAFVGFVCGFTMVASAVVNDINVDTVSDNDFVQIETFEDYGGDIVPYVSDPYIEDNSPNDVVEEITVNQTVIDNTEVLNRVESIDTKINLLNQNFMSVMSLDNSSNGGMVSLTPLQSYNYYPSFYSDHIVIRTDNTYSFLLFDISDYDSCVLDPVLYKYSSVEVLFYSDMPTFVIGNNPLPDLRKTFGSFSSSVFFDTSDYSYCVVTYYTSSYPDLAFYGFGSSGGDTPDTPPSDPSGNDPSQPSINVTYPQEVIDSVKDMKKQLVTLTGVTLLNLIIPMFVSVFKRMVDPFKKRRED